MQNKIIPYLPKKETYSNMIYYPFKGIRREVINRYNEKIVFEGRGEIEIAVSEGQLSIYSKHYLDEKTITTNYLVHKEFDKKYDCLEILKRTRNKLMQGISNQETKKREKLIPRQLDNYITREKVKRIKRMEKERVAAKIALEQVPLAIDF